MSCVFFLIYIINDTSRRCLQNSHGIKKTNTKNRLSLLPIQRAYGLGRYLCVLLTHLWHLDFFLLRNFSIIFSIKPNENIQWICCMLGGHFSQFLSENTQLPLSRPGCWPWQMSQVKEFNSHLVEMVASITIRTTLFAYFPRRSLRTAERLAIGHP